MINAIGTYKRKSDKIVLYVPLDLDTFTSLKAHVIHSMFFAVRVVASKRRAFNLCSIGDHLDKHNRQDPVEADIHIGVDLKTTPTKETIYKLDLSDHWFVTACHDTEEFSFSVRKKDYFIENRNYTDVG